MECAALLGAFRAAGGMAVTQSNHASRTSRVFHYVFRFARLVLFLVALTAGSLNTPVAQAQSLQETLASLKALKIMNEGQALVAEGKSKSIHEGIAKYKEAASLFHQSGLLQGEVAALIALGMAYSTLEEWDNALNYFNEAIPMARSLKERLMEATALTALGFTYSMSNQYAKAVSVYGEGLALLKGYDEPGDRTMRGALLTGLGLNCVQTGELKKGFAYLEQALALKRELKDAAGEAQVLTAIGATYLRLGQTEKALEHDNRALAIARSVPEKTVEAMALGALGGVYRDLGQNEKALELFNLELNIRQTLGDRSNISSSLNHIAAVYANMNDTANAFKYYKQSLQIERDSATLNNLGDLYKTVGEFQQAVDLYSEALLLTRQENDRRGQAAVLTNFGAFYRQLGEPETAKDYYKQALPLMRAMSSPTGEAAILGHMGTILLEAGRRQEALTHFTRALQLSRGADRFGELSALINIGYTYSELGKKLEALDYYDRAMPIAQAIKDRLAIATILNNTGDIYRSQRQFKKALDMYEQALAIVRNVGDRSKEVSTLGNIAKTRKDIGDLKGARTSIEAALDILESLRTKIGSQNLRSSYFAKEHSYYEFEIDLLMELHKRSPAERLDILALQISERSRARSLNELLIESYANVRQGVDPHLLERERSLLQQINAKAFARVKLDRIPNTAEQAIMLRKETDALINELQQVEGQIRQSSPRYAALTQYKPLDVRETQAQLDSDTLLLEYSLGKERSYLWLVSSSEIRSFELPATKEIEVAAQRFIEVLRARTDIYTSAPRPKNGASGVTDFQRREILDNVERLSQMLLGPVASQLGQKRLVIVADDVLETLPFAALPDIAFMKDQTANLQPLLVQHEIVSLPSISALATLRDKPERKSPPKELFVLADPVFDRNDERVKPDSKNQEKITAGHDEKQIERLTGSRMEADGISALLPANKVRKALDFEANKKLIDIEDLSQYRYVHFATHGSVDSQHPQLTSIELSLVDEKGDPQDGFLRAHDVYNLNLQADLVVLSACDTGLGKIVKGEGLIGLTRGFMYAGARRVIVTFWRVTDESTARLMMSFYRGMIEEGKRPAEALRAAQLEMLKSNNWQAPYYWAGFVLQGEWR